MVHYSQLPRSNKKLLCSASAVQSLLVRIYSSPRELFKNRFIGSTSNSESESSGVSTGICCFVQASYSDCGATDGVACFERLVCSGSSGTNLSYFADEFCSKIVICVP